MGKRAATGWRAPLGEGRPLHTVAEGPLTAREVGVLAGQLRFTARDIDGRRCAWTAELAAPEDVVNPLASDAARLPRAL